MRVLVTVAVALIASLGFGLWFLNQPEQQRERPASDARLGEPPAAAIAEPAADAASGSAAQKPKVPDPAGATPSVRDTIQHRLDALAEAYNAGDVVSADKALDDNHAVIRPDGRTLSRADTLRQWETEWTQLRDRVLTMQVESVTEEAGLITATWSVDLRATALGDDGVEHDFEFSGTQLAVYRRQASGHLLLEEPIRYTRAYQAIDGHAVNPYQ